jgi:hypothetical protein
MPLADFDDQNLLGVPKFERLKKYGFYRSTVIETNDPLNMNRVRVRIEDIHGYDLPRSSCPWATPSSLIGGLRKSFFIAPEIGDSVWVSFEQGDPRLPIYFGYASAEGYPDYVSQQIHTEPSPIIIEDDDETATEISKIKRYNYGYLPLDGRPKRTGYVDGYGNADFSSAVGYHSVHEGSRNPESPEIGINNPNRIPFRGDLPKVNEPDLKYMLRCTKYGHMQLMSDQGYYWRKSKNSAGTSLGEFGTDDNSMDGVYQASIDNMKFEAKRWNTIERMLMSGGIKQKWDGPYENVDQRRQLFMTRYGHLLDMRDTGWAQQGPLESKTREGEYGEPSIISLEDKQDLRFWRARTKGGMYFIMGDKGFHPQEDKYVRQTLSEDLKRQDRELMENWGGNQDARFISLMTRYGLKFVLDDRGSNARNADRSARPNAMGVLLKTRRSPGTASAPVLGRPRGYFLQMVDHNAMNSLMMGSPMGHCLEMSDKYQYMMLSSTLGRRWSQLWDGFKSHEYNIQPAMRQDPERTSHHLKLDHANEYIRLKTRGGRGFSPSTPKINSGVSKRDLQQGFEARDGDAEDGPWVELVDSEHRGIWMSKKNELLIIRGKKRKELYIWMDDKSKDISIYNGENSGTIKVHSKGNIELKSERNVTIEAGGVLNLKGRRIHMHAEAGSRLTMGANVFCNAKIHAELFRGEFPGVMPGVRAGSPSTSGTVNVEPLEPLMTPEKIEPQDRGKTYNGPFIGFTQPIKSIPTPT